MDRIRKVNHIHCPDDLGGRIFTVLHILHSQKPYARGGRGGKYKIDKRRIQPVQRRLVWKKNAH